MSVIFRLKNYKISQKNQIEQRKKLLRQGLWFFFFNTTFLLLIATRYFKYFLETDNFLAVLYLIITTLGHFTTLSAMISLLYIPAILIVPNKTFAWIFAAILSTTGSIVLLLDTFAFDLYRMHINRFILELIFGGAANQIFQFHIKQYILSFGVVLVILIVMLYVAYKFFQWGKILLLKKGIWITASIALMILSTHLIHIWADAVNYTPITKSSRYYPLFFPTTARKLVLKFGIVDEIESNNNLLLFTNKVKKDLNYPQNTIISDTTCKTNIILISIDSWYYKILDSTTMPNVYKFSKQSNLYTKHFSGSNGTRTGIFSLFYSIPGTYWDIVLATKTRPVFIDILLKNNYQIKTFPSASLKNPPFDCTIFKNINNINLETQGNSAHDRDIQITSDWLSQTEKYSKNEKSQPFFSFIFYDALHAMSHPADFKGPFQPEWEYPKYQLLHNNIDKTPFLNLYKNSAYFVDSLIGKILVDLKQKELLNNSWVIITGDHGQEFNDNKKNYWGHNGNYSAAQMQVPLIIHKPEGQHDIYNHWTSHYDIVPTIMTELFHCKNSIADYSIGKHINDTENRNWLFVGSSDNFGILQPNRINSVHFQGTFDITDCQLNPIKGAKLQTDLINNVMRISKSYYNK